MAISITKLLAPWDKTATLKSMYDLLGVVFGEPLALQPGEPIPAVLDTVVGWAVDDVLNPIIIPALQSQLLDFAFGDWLSLRAFADENRPRIEQVSGTQTIVLENRGSFFGTIAVGAIRVAATSGPATGKTYTNTTPGTLVAFVSGPFPTVSLTFEADEAGSASNTDSSTIPVYPSTPVKAPIGVFVKNVAGPILGSDEEADTNLKIRIKAKPTELTPAPPRLAYLAIALDPIGALTRRGVPIPSTWSLVAPAITRARVVAPGDAEIDVYLASASGPAAGDVNTDNTDVYKVYFAIVNILAPFGISTLIVAAAVDHPVNTGTITIDVDRDANVSAAQAVATATAAYHAYFSNLPVGGNRTTPGGQGYVFYREVIAAVGKGPGVVQVATTFLADEPLSVNEVATSDPHIVANLVTQS